MSTDGSTTPEHPYARGLSGASATLWIAQGGFWWPVATMAASTDWSAAVESESAALLLAFCVLQHSIDVCMHEFRIFIEATPKHFVFRKIQIF